MFKVLSESEIPLHNYVNYVKKQEFLTRIYAYDVVQTCNPLNLPPMRKERFSSVENEICNMRFDLATPLLILIFYVNKSIEI